MTDQPTPRDIFGALWKIVTAFVGLALAFVAALPTLIQQTRAQRRLNAWRAQGYPLDTAVKTTEERK